MPSVKNTVVMTKVNTPVIQPIRAPLATVRPAPVLRR